MTYWELASKGSVEVLRLARENRLVAQELLSAELDLDIRECLSVEKAAIMLVGRMSWLRWDADLLSLWLEIVLVAMLDRLGFPDPLGRGEDVIERGDSREVEVRLEVRLRLCAGFKRGAILQTGELGSGNKQRVQTAHFMFLKNFHAL